MQVLTFHQFLPLQLLDGVQDDEGDGPSIDGAPKRSACRDRTCAASAKPAQHLAGFEVMGRPSKSRFELCCKKARQAPVGSLFRGFLAGVRCGSVKHVKFTDRVIRRPEPKPWTDGHFGDLPKGAVPPDLRSNCPCGPGCRGPVSSCRMGVRRSDVLGHFVRLCHPMEVFLPVAFMLSCWIQ